MLNVGDKVKFLNTSGGGVVAKIIDSRMVSILIEDGFEIPTMISELIRISPTEPAARFFESHYNIELPAQPEEPADAADDRVTGLPAHFAATRKSEDIYLAFVPHDQKWLISGPVDVFLINNSSFDVLYNIFSKTPANHFSGVDYGSIFPDSKLLIATINREQLTHWTDGVIQFLFHKEQSTAVLPPFNSEFKIDGKKFYKEGNYREYPVIQAKGIVAKILSLTDYFKEDGQKAHSPEVPKGPSGREDLFITPYQVAPREAVVDLHIHALMNDPVNLEKSEILDFQKNHFLKCLDSAMAGHYTRVVFIHGIGNGVLRALCIELLKKHEGIEFFDAPMSKYGAGALEVRIPHNIKPL